MVEPTATPAKEALDKNVVRLRGDRHASAYLRYILKLLTEDDCGSVTITSLGDTISKAVTLAEMVKHRVEGLHQENQIQTLEIPSEKYDGTRKVTTFRVVLSKTEPQQKGAGY